MLNQNKTSVASLIDAYQKPKCHSSTVLFAEPCLTISLRNQVRIIYYCVHVFIDVVFPPFIHAYQLHSFNIFLNSYFFFRFHSFSFHILVLNILSTKVLKGKVSYLIMAIESVRSQDFTFYLIKLLCSFQIKNERVSCASYQD